MSRCRGCDEWGAEGHWGPCANIEAAHPPYPGKLPTYEERAEWEAVRNDKRTVEELARDLGLHFIRPRGIK